MSQMIQKIPLNFTVALGLAYLGMSFYIFYTPVNFFIYLNAYLMSINIPIQLPLPFENYWAFVYAAIPASFGFYVNYRVAHGVVKGEG